MMYDKLLAELEGYIDGKNAKSIQDFATHLDCMLSIAESAISRFCHLTTTDRISSSPTQPSQFKSPGPLQSPPEPYVIPINGLYAKLLPSFELNSQPTFLPTLPAAGINANDTLPDFPDKKDVISYEFHASSFIDWLDIIVLVVDGFESYVTEPSDHELSADLILIYIDPSSS